jgi:hypothetical protein
MMTDEKFKMKHTLNSNSWHCWLANLLQQGNEICPGDTMDICSYIIRITRGVFVLMVAFIIAAVVGGMAGMMLISVWDLVQWMLFGGPALSEIEWVLVSVITFFLCFFMYEWLDYRASVRPGFLTLAYRKFKSKSCCTINFD